MKEIKKHLDNAFGFLSRIPVTGDSVDMLALARQELREVYQMLNEQEKKNDGGD